MKHDVYENYYTMNIEIGVVYGWAEVKKKIAYCGFNEAGEVTMFCNNDECFK